MIAMDQTFILIEAKTANTELMAKHTSQLMRYFLSKNKKDIAVSP